MASSPPTSATANVERAVERFQAGIDRDGSFRLLFEAHYRRVRRFFLRRGFSAEDSLDLTQETFLRIYTGLETYRGEGPFAAWLFQVAANVYRKRLRRASTAKRSGLEVPLPREGEPGREPVDDSAAGRPEERMLDREQQERLRRAIAELSDQRRRCVVLWAYHGLTYSQIAVAMHLSLGTVKAHLAQAKQKLQEHFGT